MRSKLKTGFDQLILGFEVWFARQRQRSVVGINFLHEAFCFFKLIAVHISPWVYDCGVSNLEPVFLSDRYLLQIQIVVSDLVSL